MKLTFTPIPTHFISKTLHGKKKINKNVNEFVVNHCLKFEELFFWHKLSRAWKSHLNFWFELTHSTRLHQEPTVSEFAATGGVFCENGRLRQNFCQSCFSRFCMMRCCYAGLQNYHWDLVCFLIPAIRISKYLCI